MNRLIPGLMSSLLFCSLAAAQAPVQLNECNEVGSPPRINCVQTGVASNPLVTTPNGGTQDVNIAKVGGNTVVSTVPVASLATSSIVGAVSTAGVTAAASTNATLVAATPGNVYAAKFCNTTAFALYFKFYDLTVAPTVGTSTPVVPPITLMPGACSPVMEGPLSFVNGISYAITGAAANADTTVVTASSVIGTIFYKAQ